MCREMRLMRLSTPQIAKRVEADPTTRPPPDFVRCGQCDECLRDKANDRLGRALAEANTCRRFHVLTCTYDPAKCVDAAGIDHAALPVLKDMQDLFKRLRAAGFACRYIYVFEFGDENRRVHVHLVIYWMTDEVPFLKTGSNHWSWSFWPWGTVNVKPGNGKTVRYALKYLLKTFKNQGSGRIVWGCSKQPPLGTTFMKALAAQWVEAGLCPEYMTYTLPQCVLPNGKRWQFRIFGTSLRIFQAEYDRLWKLKYPGRPFPRSDRLVKGRVSRAHKEWRKVELQHIEARLEARLKGEPAPVFPPNPRPIVEGQVPTQLAPRSDVMRDDLNTQPDLTPRGWEDVMPGRPYDDTDPARKPRRVRFSTGFHDKPYDEPQAGASLERGCRGSEAGTMTMVYRKARG